VIARTAKIAGLDKVSLAGWLNVDTSRIGKLDGLTLVDALRALHEATGKPVALVIDEAQRALTSEAGEAAMTALKSARDELNRPGLVNLMPVMSGSDRDKLLRLLNTNGSPFFGSQIKAMPALGADFMAHIQLIEAQRPDLAPVDQLTRQAAFAGFGSRPQFFMEALGQVLSPLAALSVRFESAMPAATEQRQRDDEAQMASYFLGLKPLEQAVLWRMLAQGVRFRPYDAEALRFYRERTGLDTALNPQQAQNALESLRQRTPALVWKSAPRGIRCGRCSHAPLVRGARCGWHLATAKPIRRSRMTVCSLQPRRFTPTRHSQGTFFTCCGPSACCNSGERGSQRNADEHSASNTAMVIITARYGSIP